MRSLLPASPAGQPAAAAAATADRPPAWRQRRGTPSPPTLHALGAANVVRWACAALQPRRARTGAATDEAMQRTCMRAPMVLRGHGRRLFSTSPEAKLVAVIPGDGIGPEVMAEAIKVMDTGIFLLPLVCVPVHCAG